MSDEQTPVEEGEGIKKLREKAEQGSAAIDENARLKREMAFMRAGIDTTSKPAQALIASYSGELDPDAIKAEAAEWGLVKGEAPPVQQYDENSPERQQQEIREQTSGQPAPVLPPPEVNGMDKAISGYHENRTKGMADEAAQVQAFGEVIRAAAGGDKSTIFDPSAWAAEQERAGHGR
jgi:hypothetical protein